MFSSDPNFTARVKNSFYTNLRLLISNMTIVFKTLAQKHLNKAFLIFRDIFQSDHLGDAGF